MWLTYFILKTTRRIFSVSAGRLNSHTTSLPPIATWHSATQLLLPLGFHPFFFSNPIIPSSSSNKRLNRILLVVGGWRMKINCICIEGIWGWSLIMEGERRKVTAWLGGRGKGWFFCVAQPARWCQSWIRAKWPISEKRVTSALCFIFNIRFQILRKEIMKCTEIPITVYHFFFLQEQ